MLIDIEQEILLKGICWVSAAYTPIAGPRYDRVHDHKECDGRS